MYSMHIIFTFSGFTCKYCTFPVSKVSLFTELGELGVYVYVCTFSTYRIDYMYNLLEILDFFELKV